MTIDAAVGRVEDGVVEDGGRTEVVEEDDDEEALAPTELTGAERSLGDVEDGGRTEVVEEGDDEEVLAPTELTGAEQDRNRRPHPRTRIALNQGHPQWLNSSQKLFVSPLPTSVVGSQISLRPSSGKGWL